mgnify:CR=1 FL=1
MARIAGINIPMNKHIGIGLTHIFGIGPARALASCTAAGIDLQRLDVRQAAGQLAARAIEGETEGNHRLAERGDLKLCLQPYALVGVVEQMDQLTKMENSVKSRMGEMNALSAKVAAMERDPVSPNAHSFAMTKISATATDKSPAERFRRFSDLISMGQV